MSDRKHYSKGQLDEIAEAVWGSGRYQPGIERYEVPCPECGGDIRVYVDQTIRRPPPRFRAICSICGIDTSAKATSCESKQLTDEEMDEIVELFFREQRTMCPVCTAPLDVEELEIAGSGTRHFMIRCYRCGSYGQK